jgi:hypothetical protein
MRTRTDHDCDSEARDPFRGLGWVGDRATCTSDPSSVLARPESKARRRRASLVIAALFLTLAFVAVAAADVEITDAVSREFSVLVETTVEITDAVSREFSVHVQPTGFSQDDPVAPSDSSDNGFGFCGVITHSWFDPPSCYGYKYVMISDALFTSIADFPTGFVAPFAVRANGQLMGTFGPGQSANFTDRPGGRVSSFTVTGIMPLRDPGDPLAFPLKIDFNTQTADFEMFPIITADADADTDVDLSDFLLFQACATGPAIPYSPGCESKDFDGDGNVDLADFGVFQRCYSGPNNPANLDCGN